MNYIAVLFRMNVESPGNFMVSVKVVKLIWISPLPGLATPLTNKVLFFSSGISDFGPSNILGQLPFTKFINRLSRFEWCLSFQRCLFHSHSFRACFLGFLSAIPPNLPIVWKYSLSVFDTQVDNITSERVKADS